tara:strand:+ start:329 stop:559 length:231 start_codon:yes stop_codon:yes gene_type:complete
MRFVVFTAWENIGDVKLELLSTSSTYEEAPLTDDQFKLTLEVEERVDPLEGEINDGVFSIVEPEDVKNVQVLLQGE